MGGAYSKASLTLRNVIIGGTKGSCCRLFAFHSSTMIVHSTTTDIELSGLTVVKTLLYLYAHVFGYLPLTICDLLLSVFKFITDSEETW